VLLTGRGAAVLAGALCCYLIGELAGYPLFRAFAGIGLAAVALAVAVVLVAPQVEVSRTVHPDRVERGKPALASLVVRNATNRRQGGFTAGEAAGAEVHPIRVRPLAPGAEATYRYELPTTRRGQVQVGPLALNRFDPLGLARSSLTTGGTVTLWVYPRRYPVHPARVGYARHHHDGPITDPPLRGSVDLRNVREYQVGDEVRYLHWRATARTGQLMVREYADPAQLRLAVVLDTRAGAMSPDLFEDAVEVAASLLYASAAAGHFCRLLTSAGHVSKAGSGLQTARTLLDELTRVGQDTDAKAPLLPGAVRAKRPGGFLAMITGARTDLGSARLWRPDTVIRLGDPSSANGFGDGSPTVIAASDAADAVAKWNGVSAGPA
jgi:uncharacterized protein (DUF58 family)